MIPEHSKSPGFHSSKLKKGYDLEFENNNKKQKLNPTSPIFSSNLGLEAPILYQLGANSAIEQNIFSVCKLWNNFKRILIAGWSNDKRTLVINCIHEFSLKKQNSYSSIQRIVFINSANRFLNHYKNLANPSLHSSTYYMREWLSIATYNFEDFAQLALKILHEDLGITQTKPDAHNRELADYLNDQLTDIAFACPNLKDYRNMVQIGNEYIRVLVAKLIHQKGFEKTLRLILAYNNPKSMPTPYHAYFDEGFFSFKALRFNEFEMPPFIQSLDLLTDIEISLPPSQIHHLLERVMHVSLSRQYFLDPGYVDDFIESAFCIITNFCKEYTFENSKTGTEPCDFWVNNYYIDYYYRRIFFQETIETSDSLENNSSDNSTIAISAENLLQDLHAIPHEDLRRIVAEKIVDYAYSQSTSTDELLVWWSIIHRIEREFNLQEVTWESGYITYDNSTEKLIQSLMVTPGRLMFILKNPSNDLKEFPKAVKALFMNPESHSNSIISTLPNHILDIIEKIT